MAAYTSYTKVINGTPAAAAAEADTYIATLDSTTQAITSMSIVGGNDFVTILITHLSP